MGRRFCCFSLTGAACILVGVLSGRTEACNCHQAHALSMGIPSYGGFSIAQPMMAQMEMTPIPFYGEVRGAAQLPLFPSPPGTVGQTYSRPSHPVPSDEHPRTGMLAVRDNGSIPFLSVQTMGGIKMKSGIWLFESNRPLDPGASQIVRVEARHAPQDIEPYSTKFVRLIPGRIVYLDF